MKFSRQEITVLKAILRTRRRPGAPVLIQDVIKAISYYTKETSKRALISLAQKGVVSLSSHDFPQSLTANERKYFIREKGTGRRRIGGGYDDRYYHAVVIRDDSSLPEEVKNPVRTKRTMKKNKTIIKARRVIALTNRTRKRRRNPFGFDVLKGRAYGRSQKAQLASVSRNIASLKKRIAKEKQGSTKAALRALMIELQGTKYDLEQAIRANERAKALEKRSRRTRRNSEKRDSDHPIEVTRHWRAGPPGYLTQWQRARAAGQRELFETGIKPATRRNPKIDKGTKGWILVSVREAVKEGQSWAYMKDLLERSGFDSDVVKMAEGMFKAESGGKGSAKSKQRMGLNPGKTRRGTSRPGRRRSPRRSISTRPATKTRRRTSTTRPRPNGVRETVRKFGGRPDKKKTVSVQAPLNTPGTVGRLGKIKKIQLKSGRYYDFTDRKTAPYLATDSRNKLHVVGGKYRINPPGTDQGEITRIIYEAQKPHLDHPKMEPYYHDFGEDDGRRPRLKIDPEGFMHIVGGNYSLEADGIHN